MRKENRGRKILTAQEITSETSLTEFDFHFRVFAGPGAGKTHWLINHIKNVLKNSKRLSPSMSIACISYTNVAVNEIIERLGSSGDRVEVSTIHSFLYKNVVKPYLYLLKDDHGQDLVNHSLVDGHDEHIPTYANIEAWLSHIGARPVTFHNFSVDQENWKKYLRKLRWQINIETEEYLPQSLNTGVYPKFLPSKQLNMAYKKSYWSHGIIDHDDVLCFASLILKKYPLIRQCLSARYPYLFIDEFQDTNPVQTQMMKWFGGETTKVGVIGDEEQAIYGFQGAKYEDFKNFDLPGHVDYKIEGNKRSTNKIIQLLNHIRGDGLKQTCLRRTEGDLVCCLAGPVKTTIPNVFKAIAPDSELFILARTNDEISSIRRLDNSGIDNDLWGKFEQVDSERASFIEDLIISTELIRQKAHINRIKDLIKVIAKSNGEVKSPIRFNRKLTEQETRGVAISLLEFMINHYAQIYDESILEIYQKLSDLLSEILHELNLKALKSGKIKAFIENTKYKDLASSIRLPDEIRRIRTIHQAKSAEFKNVLVCLKRDGGTDQFEFILNPQSFVKEDVKEEKRIIYVALSRAKDKLYIQIPSITPEEEAKVKALNLEVVKVG
jgi:DNA helicase II / ATP-dependent DNA helicase PcrA